MLLFDFLRISSLNIKEIDSKVHLAVWNCEDDPVDFFLAGDFEEWQSWQSRRKFQRKYIISLLQLPGNERWLFAGCFLSEGYEYIESEKYYLYKTSEVIGLRPLAGKLIVTFSRSGRQSYLKDLRDTRP